MSFIEFLGLIISFMALLVLSIKQKREDRRRREHPELYEQENLKRQQSLKELFRSMNIELEEEKEDRRQPPEEEEEKLQPTVSKAVRQPLSPPKTPPRMVGKQYALQYKLDRFKQVRPIDQRRLKSAIDKRHIGRQVVSQDMVSESPVDAYALTKQVSRSRGRDLLSSLKSSGDMIILYEILHQPKGLDCGALNFCVFRCVKALAVRRSQTGSYYNIDPFAIVEPRGFDARKTQKFNAPQSSILDRYQTLSAEVSRLAIACGRDPKEITLVAVTKTCSYEAIAAVYEAGCRDVGESRVQDALQKMTQLPPDLRWHFIGTLQANKVRKVVGQFVLIHSVDSPELARRISFCSGEMGITSHVLLQVNTSGETSKHGLSVEGWRREFQAAAALPHIAIDGLMTMAPLTDDVEVIRSSMRQLRLFRDELGLKHLSMGMSHDYEIAIEEGATLIRLGSALFHNF